MNVQFSDGLVNDLEALLEKLEKAAVQGVVGIDRGYRYKAGVRQDQVCTRVFLEGQKIPAARLARRQNIAAILKEEVDVIDLAVFDFPREGMPPALEGRPDPVASKSLNPIQPGISVSHFGQGAGTLGLVVYRNGSGEPAVLSCAHVIAGQFARRNDAIFQPALLDGGEPDFDAIGYLESWFVDRDGDAAIAVLNRSRMVAGGQFGTEQKPLSAAPVKLGDLVEKSGRGSGVTRALVDGIGLYRMTLAGFGPRWISGFRLVPRNASRSEEISRPGDSGAVWYRVNGSTQGVGLHIDGETPRGNGIRQPEYAIACHLTKVLDRLDVSMSWPREKAPAPGPVLTNQATTPAPAWQAELRAKLAEVIALLDKGAAERPDPAAPVLQDGPYAPVPEPPQPALDPPAAQVVLDWIQRYPGEARAFLASVGTNGSANGEGKASAARHP